MAVIILCLFLTVLCIGLQCVIVAFPGRIHLFFFYTVLESGAAITTELFLMMSIVICMSSKRISDYASVTEIKRAL